MWIEVPANDIAATFKPFDKVRVKVHGSRDYTGVVTRVFPGNDEHSTYVSFAIEENDYPITLYAWSSRTFYKWVDLKPEDSVNVLESQARLRLRKPDPDRHPEVQAEVEAAEAALVERIERLEERVGRTVVVGRVAYTVREGDHLRIWWEDGRLHTEYVQGGEG